MLPQKRQATPYTQVRNIRTATFHHPVRLVHVDKHLNISLPKQLMAGVEKYQRVYPSCYVFFSILWDHEGQVGLKMFQHLKLPQVSGKVRFCALGSLGFRRNHTGIQAPLPTEEIVFCPEGVIPFLPDLWSRSCSLSSCTFLLTLAVPHSASSTSSGTILEYLGSLNFLLFLFPWMTLFFPVPHPPSGWLFYLRHHLSTPSLVAPCLSIPLRRPSKYSYIK